MSKAFGTKTKHTGDVQAVSKPADRLSSVYYSKGFSSSPCFTCILEWTVRKAAGGERLGISQSCLVQISLLSV